MENLPTIQGSSSLFFDVQKFEHAQRVAKVFAASTMVPEHFRNNIGNTLIAMNYADRIGADLFMCMQTMCVIHGKPGIEGKLVIALLNNSGRFEPLEFEERGNLRNPKNDDDGCVAYTRDLKSGKVLRGPIVDWAMVKAEGWLSKNGSKWKTMAPLMFRYRAATYFARTYCPEVLLGMQTREEINDSVVVMQQNNLGHYETAMSQQDDDAAPADMSMYGGTVNAEEQPEAQTEAPKETAPPATAQTEEKAEPLGLSMNENQLIELLQRQLEGVGVKSPESFSHVLDYLDHNVKTTGKPLIDVLRVAVNNRPAQLMISVTEWHASKAEKQAAGTDWDPREAEVMNRYVAEKSAKVKAVAEEMGIPTDGRKPSEVHADILAACQEPPDDIVDPGPGSGTGDGRHDEHPESIPDIRNISLELRNKNQVRWDDIVKTLIRAKQVKTTFIEGMSPEELELICDEFRAADEDKF